MTAPFCYSPTTNIDINPGGSMSPCCKFRFELYTEQFNIATASITDYRNSAFLAEVQNDFAQQQWPRGCVRCKIEEENNISSKRQLDFERWSQQYTQHVPESDGFITASVAFGNTCNLKCITCNPVSSSRWRSEYTSIYLKDVAHYNFYKQDFVTDFTAAAPNLIHIDIPGGEPFLSGVPEQKQLLRYYVDSGQAASMTLHYTTNATVWPDPDWWELWSHFKEIDMQLSIDGVGARYEYIRYPAVWSVLVKTVQAYLDKQSLPNFRLSVSHTVSAYNILYLDEFFTWCYNIKLPKPWTGRVHTPVHMRPSVWSNHARNIIIEKLQQSQHADVVTWSQLIANTNDSEHFDQFCNRLQQHDQYRGTDFKTTFPELANYI
jgi:hypothetical protein